VNTRAPSSGGSFEAEHQPLSFARQYDNRSTTGHNVDMQRDRHSGVSKCSFLSCNHERGVIRLEDPIRAKAFHIHTDQANRPDQPHEELLAARFETTVDIHALQVRHPQRIPLPVALRHTLQLVLLLDGVRVAATLGSVDELFSQALSDALDVAERGLAGTDGEEGNGLVDAAEGRHIDGLTTDGTGRSDTGGVFAGSTVDDGVHGDLDGVLVGHDVDLGRVSAVQGKFRADCETEQCMRSGRRTISKA